MFCDLRDIHFARCFLGVYSDFAGAGDQADDQAIRVSEVERLPMVSGVQINEP